MKKNDLVKIVNFFVAMHRRSGQKVNVYFPRKHFPNSDLQAIRKRLNAVCVDVSSKQIIEQEALVIFDIDPILEEI